MKLSVVVICWNDLKFVLNCIQSVFAETNGIDFEIIVTDNASTDGSVAAIAERFPSVRIVQNENNLGFGRGNNAGIRAATGEYVLILNPDTIIRDRALTKLVDYAERHPEGGAFGCRVLNADGSVQLSAHPLPTISNSLTRALFLRWPARLWPGFVCDRYLNWNGRAERSVGFQGGCCLLMRGSLLNKLKGFDERFFHQFEDADLCRRVWNSGHSVLFCPSAEIIHISGQSRGTYNFKVELEIERSRYKYFHKYYGTNGLIWIRYISMLGLGVRYALSSMLRAFVSSETLVQRLRRYAVILKWHWKLDPVGFVKNGSEPDVEPLRLRSTQDF